MKDLLRGDCSYLISTETYRHLLFSRGGASGRPVPLPLPIRIFVPYESGMATHLIHVLLSTFKKRYSDFVTQLRLQMKYCLISGL